MATDGDRRTTNLSPVERERLEDQRKLATEYLRKKRAGEKPTVRERRAWEAVQKHQDREAGLRFVEAVPKKLYCEWARRQTKSIHDHARQYDLPLYEPTISIPDLVLAVHNLLAEFGKRNISPTGDPLLEGGESPALERYRNAAADVKELERDRLRGELLPRTLVHKFLLDLSAQVRKSFELACHHPETSAAELFEELFSDIQKITSDAIDSTPAADDAVP